MSTLKLIGCVAVIIGCFAVLYPRFMHPLVLRLFGLHKVKTESEQQTYPPGLGRPGIPRPRPEDVKRTVATGTPGDPMPMRPGPHPGMRAAAEMNRQHSQGSGRGMMGVVLPMYAVGIIVYLVYTLVKVFNKRSDNRSRYPQWSQEGRSAFSMDAPPDPRTMQETDLQKLLSGASPGKDLEELLLRADDQNVSAAEMRELQKRLEETEAQMHRILAAMQNVHQKVSTVVQPGDAAAAEAAKDAPAEAAKDAPADSPTGNSSSSTAPPQQTEKATTSEQNPETPDTESYEVIKNISSSSDASPLTELPDQAGTPVETVGAVSTPSPDSSADVAEAGKKQDAEEEVEEVVLVDKADKEEEEDQDGESTVRHRKPTSQE